MADQKPLFKAPYDIKDVSALFAIVAFVLIIAAIVGNNLFGLFQQNVNFGWSFLSAYWFYVLSKIEDFLNKSIDSMVYALKFFDVRDIKITDDDKSELVQKLTNYLNVSIEVGDGDLFVSEEGEYDEEFWKPIDDLSELTTRVLQMGLSYENTDLNLDPSGSL